MKPVFKHVLPAAALALLSLLPALAESPVPDYAQCGLKVETSLKRDLTSWKPLIAKYSARHYGEDQWQLDPKAIVLHYTVSTSFPMNLVNTPDFAGETPGLAVHYVVDGNRIWEVLPPNVRSRGAYGINHRAINIEMVAMEAKDLAKRANTLKTSAKLTECLMKTYQLPKSKVYSHEDVSKMNPKLIPEVKDLLHPEAYHKIDPGSANMKTILDLIPDN